MLRWIGYGGLRSARQGLSALLLGALFVVTAVRVSTGHIEVATPINLELAQEIASGRALSYKFLPPGYTWALGTALREFGARGILVMQGLAYVVTVVVYYEAARLITEGGTAALVIAGLISIQPQLIANTLRISDNALTPALLGAFVLCLLLICKRNSPVKVICAFAGIFLACACAVRPNLFILLPVAIAAVVLSQTRSVRDTATECAILAASFVILCSGVAVYARGAFPFPDNGAYNFYAGANPFAANHLLYDFNAEGSIPEGLRYSGYGGVVDSKTTQSHGQISRIYRKLGADFVVQNPTEYIYLAALKLFTLLRPDYRREPSLWNVRALSKTVAIFPWVCWLVCAIAVRPASGFERTAFYMIAVCLMAYVIPFLITNSDPRFRVPIDSLFVLGSGISVHQFLRKRKMRSLRTASQDAVLA